MDPGRGRWPTLAVLQDADSVPEWLDDVAAHVRAICPIWGWILDGNGQPTVDFISGLGTKTICEFFLEHENSTSKGWTMK